MVRTAPSSSGSSSPHPQSIFEATNGDTLLQSSDSFLFSVHRCILIQASPVFCDLFHIPPPATLGSSPRTVVGPIPISETAHVLDALLRLIYPLPPPSFDNLSDLVPVLAACLRYQMTAACVYLRQQLISTSNVLREPLRVFAIACRFGLVAEAREASRATLRINIMDAPLCEDMRYVSAYDFQRLLVLHRERAQAARRLITGRSRRNDLTCSQCTRFGSGRHPTSPRWWYEFERRAKEELTRRPLTDIIFSMRFLSDCAKAGCTSCGTSLLDSHAFLETLKVEIDALPDTLSPTGDY